MQYVLMSARYGVLALLLALSVGCSADFNRRFAEAQRYGEASFNRRALQLIEETLTLRNTTIVACETPDKGSRVSTTCLAW